MPDSNTKPDEVQFQVTEIEVVTRSQRSVHLQLREVGTQRELTFFVSPARRQPFLQEIGRNRFDRTIIGATVKNSDRVWTIVGYQKVFGATVIVRLQQTTNKERRCRALSAPPEKLKHFLRANTIVRPQDLVGFTFLAAPDGEPSDTLAALIEQAQPQIIEMIFHACVKPHDD